MEQYENLQRDLDLLDKKIKLSQKQTDLLEKGMIAFGIILVGTLAVCGKGCNDSNNEVKKKLAERGCISFGSDGFICPN